MEKSNNDLFELMTKMYTDMNNRMDSMDNRINKISNDMQEGFKNVNNKIDNLEVKMDTRFDTLTSDIGNLVTNDIAYGISNQITDVKGDIKFIKHKINTTEEDVYKIQDHLKIIK